MKKQLEKIFEVYIEVPSTYTENKYFKNSKAADEYIKKIKASCDLLGMSYKEEQFIVTEHEVGQ